MQIKKLLYTRKTGWDHKLPVDLDSERTLVLAFGACSFNSESEPLLELFERFPCSKITGCSTGGEIHGAAIRDGSIVVAVVCFSDTDLRRSTFLLSNEAESFRAGMIIAEELDSPDLRGVFVLADSSYINGSEMVAGINSKISSSVSVTGGLAGNNTTSGKTWVLGETCPESSLVSAVGFYGDHVKIGYGSRDGLDILGIEQRVTKSRKNRLFEIDGKPALSLYKQYLGEKASMLPEVALNFPISLRANLRSEKRTIRSVLDINEDDQSLTFAGDVPEGAMARLMIANPDRVIDGATEAAMMTEQYGSASGEVLSIAISCLGRRKLLAGRSEEELEAVLEGMPDGTEQIGFYSYAEICPYSVGSCDLHNQTMTLTTISED